MLVCQLGFGRALCIVYIVKENKTVFSVVDVVIRIFPLKRHGSAGRDLSNLEINIVLNKMNEMN